MAIHINTTLQIYMFCFIIIMYNYIIQIAIIWFPFSNGPSYKLLTASSLRKADTTWVIILDRCCMTYRIPVRILTGLLD